MTDLPCIKPQYADVLPWESCDFAFIGEAPGKDEVTQGIPFVGRAGQLLDEMLLVAGIERALCHITNVFLIRPPNNKIDHFFKRKTIAEKEGIGICTDLPAYDGLYLKEEYLPEVERLADELAMVRPKVIITLGATPMWALTGVGKGITKERGSVYSSKLLSDTSVLLTLHPSYVLRNRHEKETVIQDLIKAKQLCIS